MILLREDELSFLMTPYTKREAKNNQRTSNTIIRIGEPMLSALKTPNGFITYIHERASHARKTSTKQVITIVRDIFIFYKNDAVFITWSINVYVYPASLSYHAITLTRFLSTTRVILRSAIEPK